MADELRQLIAEDRISEDALRNITKIQPDKLAAFLGDGSPNTAGLTADEQALSSDENTRVSVLAAQLVHGLGIDDDARLQGILESLTAECGLSAENIANLTGVDIADIQNALEDPGMVPFESKYRLALKGSYLINAATQARPR